MKPYYFKLCFNNFQEILTADCIIEWLDLFFGSPRAILPVSHALLILVSKKEGWYPSISKTRAKKEQDHSKEETKLGEICYFILLVRFRNWQTV